MGGETQKVAKRRDDGLNHIGECSILSPPRNQMANPPLLIETCLRQFCYFHRKNTCNLMTLEREKKVCTEQDYWESLKNTCFCDKKATNAIEKQANITETIDFLRPK